MQTLSDNAFDLLRLHFSGRYLSMRRGSADALPRRTVDETRLAYRELVDAGLMIPVSTFAGGPEAIYRLTRDGDRKCMELQRPALGLMVRDSSENAPCRVADRQLGFRRPKHGVIVTAREIFRILMRDYRIDAITQAGPRP